VIENNSAQEQVTTLEDYLEAVKNRKWVVLATAAALVVLAVAITSRQTPIYVATASVEVLPSISGSTNANPTPANMDLEAEKMLGDSIRETVAERLDIEVDFLPNPDVEFLPTSRVLFLERRDADPQQAADIVNFFSDAYVEQRIEVDRNIYGAKIAALADQVEDLEVSISELAMSRSEKVAERLREIRRTTDTLAEHDAIVASVSDEITAIQTDMNFASSDLRTAQSRLQAEVLNRDSTEDAASVIRRATVPASPSGLAKSVVWIAAGIAGILFGTAVAFLVERLDATARDENDVALALRSKVLGSVPTFGLGNRGGPSSAVMLINDHKPRLAQARESIRRLRSSVQFAAASSDGQVFLMTSAYPGEGKSVVSANLAAALAQSGKKVALVNADMRRPTMEVILNVPNTDGLSNFLTGRDEVMNLREVQGVAGLFFVPSGPPPANPGELLGSPQFERLIKDLRTHADYVLIDSPPVLSTADAVTASRFVDGVIVVVDSRRTETSDLLRVREDLDRAGAPLLGAVLNKVRATSGVFNRRDAYAYYGTGQS
jgi:capsular exopolysaccharide synthesis family protein